MLDSTRAAPVVVARVVLSMTAQATTTVPKTTRMTLGTSVRGRDAGSELRSGYPSCKCLIYLPYFFSAKVCFLIDFLLVEVRSQRRSYSHWLLMMKGTRRS
jgi:hypothetical protein